MEMLSAETSPTDAVRRSAQLLACTRLGIVVDIPVKTVSALVAHLVAERAGEDDAGVDALQHYHAQVREYLMCLQRGAEADAAERLTALEDGLDELRTAVFAKTGTETGGSTKHEDDCSRQDAEDGEQVAEELSSPNVHDAAGARESEERDEKVKRSKKSKKRAD